MYKGFNVIAAVFFIVLNMICFSYFRYIQRNLRMCQKILAYEVTNELN